MASCKDCICGDICIDRYVCGDRPACEHFKDRSKFVELPCKVGSEVFVTPDIVDKISQELQNAGFTDASKWLDCKYEL